MDRRACNRAMNGRTGKGISALLLLAFLLAGAGCRWGARGGGAAPQEPEGHADNTAPVAVIMEWLPPAVAMDGAGDAAGTPATDNTTIDNTTINAPEAIALAAVAPPDAKGGSDASLPSAAAPSLPSTSADGDGGPGPSASTPPGGTNRADAKPPVVKPKPPAAPPQAPAVAPKDAGGGSLPGWAKSPEELVYRVDFIGITMGYARFRYQGKVSIGGRAAYHLNVRAWTSGVLSFLYPINDTIDYYLDTETLAPIRQEFTKREKGTDDVALYDQETGRITYRYRQSGEIRKQVATVPMVYDPVSVAYYFRWRDLGMEDRPRNVYGGRKVYQISSRVLGNERIRTEHGEVDTIAVVPLIRRDGKPDNKGDLKIWFSSDERRVPVRLYAKFRKIKDWTLVGELMPKAGG